MFESLSQRLSGVLDALRGQGRLTEDQVNTASRELRMALLEADVALPVVRQFVEQVKTRALGAEVTQSLSPGQQFLKIVQQALTETLGGTTEPLNLRAQPPVVILMAGLQGSGKTTTTGKLARRLKEQDNKKVMVVSCDVYRPAAIEQLRIVAGQVGVECFPSAVGEQPGVIAGAALAEARRQYMDVLIIDTAGRTTVDAEMMAEISALHALVKPTETLFVVDSMTGQDAANTAKAFAEAVPLTGVVLTKVDGDARGGAALSVRQVTGRPIKFLGVGEKSDKLEVFHPDRIANRILGQGDMLSLIEETSRKVDQDKAAKLAEKLKKNKRFDLADFRDQMEQMENLGSIDSLLEKLPGGAQMQAQLKNVDTGKQVRRTIAIINSMTPQERRFPDLIKASRKRRIAAGSGVEVQQVNQLLRQFESTRDMMKKVAGGGMAKMMRGLAGRLPPGMMPRR
ncbi:signal recognition particle protein [Flagellatimonas centrodinii]|uniref:signal recognition particle protein n=1 Tax=Flagellatimonas centrodinii TaxID=2806210 RepID=UPI001FFC7BCD|nr:signal recognition particle protein [Flagellatimonas centrodinii]ULQ46500.1 signal recognition particle protein [Flagellatimonas centrodinii]